MLQDILFLKYNQKIVGLRFSEGLNSKDVNYYDIAIQEFSNEDISLLQQVIKKEEVLFADGNLLKTRNEIENNILIESLGHDDLEVLFFYLEFIKAYAQYKSGKNTTKYVNMSKTLKKKRLQRGFNASLHRANKDKEYEKLTVEQLQLELQNVKAHLSTLSNTYSKDYFEKELEVELIEDILYYREQEPTILAFRKRIEECIGYLSATNCYDAPNYAHYLKDEYSLDKLTSLKTQVEKRVEEEKQKQLEELKKANNLSFDYKLEKLEQQKKKLTNKTQSEFEKLNKNEEQVQRKYQALSEKVHQNKNQDTELIEKEFQLKIETLRQEREQIKRDYEIRRKKLQQRENDLIQSELKLFNKTKNENDSYVEGTKKYNNLIHSKVSTYIKGKKQVITDVYYANKDNVAVVELCKNTMNKFEKTSKKINSMSIQDLEKCHEYLKKEYKDFSTDLKYYTSSKEKTFKDKLSQDTGYVKVDVSPYIDKIALRNKVKKDILENGKLINKQILYKINYKKSFLASYSELIQGKSFDFIKSLYYSFIITIDNYIKAKGYINVLNTTVLMLKEKEDLYRNQEVCAYISTVNGINKIKVLKDLSKMQESVLSINA